MADKFEYVVYIKYNDGHDHKYATYTFEHAANRARDSWNSRFSTPADAAKRAEGSAYVVPRKIS